MTHAFQDSQYLDATGIAIRRGRAQHANAPELRQRKDRDPPEEDNGGTNRQPFKGAYHGEMRRVRE